MNMGNAIEKYCRGRVVRFEPDGESRWTVVQNGRSFEVVLHEVRDEHSWMRHTYSLRVTGEAGPDTVGLADLAAVAARIYEKAY
jgi:hypothetical protein